MINLQNPCQVAVQVLINTLHILKRHLLSEHHLVERADEERIKETTVEDSQTYNAANELEVVQMLWVHAGVRVDLQGIIIMGGVFEKTVERVKHFMGKKEEEFTAQNWLATKVPKRFERIHTEKDHHSPVHLHHRT